MKATRRPSPVRFLAAALLASALPLCSGCIVVAVGAAAAGAVAYVKGDLEANLTESVPRVASAVEATISELRLFPLTDQKDAVSALYTMRNAKDDKITITVKKTGDNLTNLTIRVGLLGDEGLSRTILDTIKKNL